MEINGIEWEERNGVSFSDQEAVKQEDLLRELGFVLVPEGRVRLGTPQPLPCRFEGHRLNETPTREIDVEPFWICKFTVTNEQFEKFNHKRVRPPTSLKDSQPITNITYFNALRYAHWLSEQLGLFFRLPTEPEWVCAAAPYGWEYPYKAERNAEPGKTHNFLIEESVYETLDLNDPRYGVNYLGLYHMGGNVQELTLGYYYTTSGAWGSLVDGPYCIVKGGDFGHCPLSAGVQRRGIYDVSGRSEKVGFRLAHPAFVIDE